MHTNDNKAPSVVSFSFGFERPEGRVTFGEIHDADLGHAVAVSHPDETTVFTFPDDQARERPQYIAAGYAASPAELLAVYRREFYKGRPEIASGGSEE